jgi:hypothetical protein
MKFKRTSEWIVDEAPDIIFSLDWKREGLLDLHPIIFEQRILTILRREQIPVLGEVCVEGVARGRLYWNDFEHLGSRTFYYHKSEPKYTPEASDKEYNICRLICPICKELCGGVSDHIEQTEDILPPESQFHGCINEHKWLAPDMEKKVRYHSLSSPIFNNISFDLENEEKEDCIDRKVRLKD